MPDKGRKHSARLLDHWPEYLIEAAGLGFFMLSACSFATLLEHPSSSVRGAIEDPFTRRALMRITAVRASASPGIEFLEYLTPRNGRPMPVDERANDLIHWQTRVITSYAEEASQALRLSKVPFISSGVVSVPEEQLGFDKGFLVRDLCRRPRLSLYFANSIEGGEFT